MSGPILSGFEKEAADRPDAPAVFALSERRVLSFIDLALEYRTVKRVLDEAGIPSGSCVISLVGNRPTWFAVFLACLARGNALMPLDADTTSTEALQLATRYRASAIVAQPANGHTPAGTAQALPGGMFLYRLERRHPVSFQGAALLKLTSGSSGEPKAVLVSEENLWNDGRHIVEAMGIRPHDVNYGAIPLSHSYGLGNLVVPLFIQGTPVALRDLFLPSRLFADAQASGASVFPGVPFLFGRILTHFPEGGLPPSFRLLLSAGARIDSSLVVSFKKRFGMKIHSFYGSSETGGITYDDDEEITDPLNVGTAMPETEVSLRRDDSAPPGEARVYVRGNAVAARYVESHDGGAASAFVDGGFLTGDLGEWDDQGRLYLTGRVSSFVNVAGRKVNPKEAEAVILEMPEVADAKVLGFPCERRGQKLVAFIVPRSSRLSSVQVRIYCAEKLTPYKIPRDLILLDSLPLTARGKVDRQVLEELARSRVPGNLDR